MNQDTIRMFIDGEEVVCNNKFSIKEEMLSASSAILNNCYPKSWEEDRDYISRFYFPYDYTKFIIGSGNYRYGIEQYYVLTATGKNPSFETNTTKELSNITTYGKSTQETTTGKNKLDTQEQPITGLTMVKQKDGSLLVNGTISETKFAQIVYMPDNTLSTGTYTLSCFDNSGNKYAGDFYIGSQYIYKNPTNDKTFTIEAGTYIVRLNLYLTAKTYTNTKIYIQLEKSPTATEYEPYTGGQPSPNPNYPQGIESVGYENLYNKDTITENYRISTAGEPYGDNSYNLSDYIEVLPNTNYVFNLARAELYNGIAFYDTNKTVIGLDSSSNRVILTPSNTKYMRFGWSKVNYTELQLEQNTIAHSYIPYGKYGIEYKTIGKNLLSVLFSKTSSGTLRSNIDNFQPGTYTFSFEMQTPGGNQVTARKIKDGITTQITLAYNAKKLTFTLDEVAILQLEIYKVGLELKDISLTMLEQGSTATPYEPYQELTQLVTLDEPLRSVGSVKDKLRIENNTLYVDRYIGRVLLNGSENWFIGYELPNSYRFHTGDIILTTSGYLVLSDNFTNETYNVINTVDKPAICKVNTHQLVIRIEKSKALTVAEFKTWLSTHPTEVIYELAEPYTENIGNIEMLHSYIGQNNFSIESGLETTHDINYYWKNYDVLFSGIVKNTGKISLNPRQPHYCNLQILDYKTFLSESDSLDFVISNKTIQEAIEMVVDYIKDYGFVLGNIELNRANEVIGAYSTLNQSPYDVLQYLAKISGSVWRTRVIDEKTTAIDFYDIEYLPYNLSILYDTQFFEDNNIVDINFSYGTRDYRNKQIILSNEVYADIPYIENVFGDGYSDTFELQENVGYINSITINGVEQKVITQEEKEIGLDYDFYYTPGKNIIVSDIIQPANTQIIVNYTPIIKGRQVIYNENEVNRVAMNTETKGVIARYETRNDTLSSNELNQIGQTYIKYKGNAEIILTLKTKDKDLYNIGERIFFDAPINELKQEYMVKSKTIEYIVLSGIPTFFYTYELTSSFNSESAINYFDNQRNKASGNISLGESITRNIDISNNTIIFFKDLTITEITATGDNILNSALNSPFNN